MLALIRRIALAAAVLFAAIAQAHAEEALVAVAANFAGAATAISAAFTEDTGHVLQITTGSTGKLFAQITEGAPFQVMLSADAKTPEMIENAGLGVVGSSFTYAVGGLTLWSADEGRIGADPKAALLADDTRFIAIANPDLAPYGIAAREALQAMGLWQTVQPKIVMGQNIGQAFSMVASGAAQIGFVATSAVAAPGSMPQGSRLDISQDMFSPIRQDAILLTPGRGNVAAEAFMVYLKGARARAIAQSFGYGME